MFPVRQCTRYLYYRGSTDLERLLFSETWLCGRFGQVSTILPGNKERSEGPKCYLPIFSLGQWE